MQAVVQSLELNTGGNLMLKSKLTRFTLLLLGLLFVWGVWEILHIVAPIETAEGTNGVKELLSALLGFVSTIAGIIIVMLVVAVTVRLIRSTQVGNGFSIPKANPLVVGSILGWFTLLGVVNQSAPDVWAYWWGHKGIFLGSQLMFLFFLIIGGKRKILTGVIAIGILGFFIVGLKHNLEKEGYAPKEPTQRAYVEQWDHVYTYFVGKTWQKIHIPNFSRPHQFRCDCQSAGEMKSALGGPFACGPDIHDYQVSRNNLKVRSISDERMKVVVSIRFSR